MPDDIEYWSAFDLARRYQVTYLTILSWAKRGLIPPGEMIGGKCRRWRSDVIKARDAARAARAAAPRGVTGNTCRVAKGSCPPPGMHLFTDGNGPEPKTRQRRRSRAK